MWSFIFVLDTFSLVRLVIRISFVAKFTDFISWIQMNLLCIVYKGIT